MEEPMQPSSTFGLSQIGQIAIPVRDLDAAVAFYRDQLGLAFLFRVSNLAFFDCAGVRLMLSLPEAAESEHSGAVLYFTVENLPAAYQALLDRAVPFVDGPHIVAQMDTYDLWMAFFRDPDGNLLGLMSEVLRG
jgi:methylmalonyl-CoA/ethylmalonyl-CoA epimerase